MNQFVSSLIRESPDHRHALVAENLPKEAKTILDVGGSSYVCVGKKWKKNLGSPSKLWNVVEFSTPETKKRRILTINVRRDYNKERRPDIFYDGLHIPFNEKSFDVVTCVDVFEHMPKQDRPVVLNELLRVATMRVIVTFPFFTEENNKMERSLLEYLKKSAIEQKPSLTEHQRYGLPHISEVTDVLTAKKLKYSITYGTDRETIKYHLLYQASINRLIKIGASEKIIKSSLKYLEKFYYRETKLSAKVIPEKAYRVVISIDVKD